jgi:hypothetical protein
MRNNLLQKLYNRDSTIFLEITLILFLLILFFMMDYFIYWQPTLDQFLREHSTLQQKQLALHQKQSQLIQEKKTESTLQQWRNRDTDFYTTMSSVSTVNQQVSLLTNLIQNAHFTILQLTKINNVKHSITDCTSTITATGQFIDLFSLITTLNHFAIPFTLSELSINQHQFKMTFILRDCRA